MTDQFKPLSKVTEDEEFQARSDTDWADGAEHRDWNPHLYVKVRPKPQKRWVEDLNRIVGPDNIRVEVWDSSEDRWDDRARRIVLDLLNKADPA